MNLTLLKCKLHRATVTGSDLNYEGSISIDRALMDAAGLLPFEQVDVLNINNGARFTTYVIEAPAGNGDIIINGAAARLVQKGDLVIICAFAGMTAQEAASFQPTVVLLGENNQIKIK
jgi:aspartate 1-decarboxylase